MRTTDEDKLPALGEQQVTRGSAMRTERRRQDAIDLEIGACAAPLKAQATLTLDEQESRLALPTILPAPTMSLHLNQPHDFHGILHDD